MTNKRPPSLLADMSYESRGIEKIAERVFDMIDDLLEDIIDPTYPLHLEDEELDDYLDMRRMRLARMVAQSMLGPDKVKEIE